ncbi:hypothetical protein V2J09_011281, partial [Rumex salicifolius]
IKCEEIILENPDVSKAILEYTKSNVFDTLVLGSSSRNGLIRKFKGSDVPTTVSKSAPDFTTVYTIYKTKILCVKSATRLPPSNPANMTQQIPSSPSQSRTSSFNDNNNYKPSSQGHHSQEERHQTGDVMGRFLCPNLTSHLWAQVDQEDVESERRRLRQELKQTIDMYNAATKEAMIAKQKAKDLQVLQMEEDYKLEEALMAEETALAIVDREKKRCKVAMEAAEASKKIAQMEAQKRKNAELKAIRESEDKKKAIIAISSNEVKCRKYSFEEIESATKKFSGSLKIGEGGYGPVYHCTLDHTPVAIKLLRLDVAQGRSQFKQEVEILSRIRHPNMVILLGACPENGCLIYEYMPNGSLEDRLFCKGNTPPLPWQVRFRIAAEIGTALLFMHQTKPQPLVHRDLKPGNILLDQNFISKIGDVGLARLVPPSVADSVTQYRMTQTAGTLCYIDPEYQQTGKLVIKSDIYSLGILFLQMITGRSPMGLTHHVQRAIQKGNLVNLLDPKIKDWPMEETLLFAKLSLKCAELRRKDRPDLAKVILPELNRFRAIAEEFF